MRLLVGLGNPGPRYAATRHNVGFRILERFADRHRIALDQERFGGRFGRGWLRRPGAEPLELGLLEPLTFMNRSGQAVAAALAGLPPLEPSADLLVAHDDVDLPFGRLRLRPGGGAGGHRGVAHLIETLGHGAFLRLRFGIGRPRSAAGEPPPDTADWVLEPFSREQEAALDERLGVGADAIEGVLFDGIVAAMNRFNREPATEAPESVE